jgi:hypothetical protein
VLTLVPVGWLATVVCRSCIGEVERVVHDERDGCSNAGEPGGEMLGKRCAGGESFSRVSLNILHALDPQIINFVN